jgi:predicted transposase YdaD
MLGINLQETRFYQEAKEEGREEGQRSLVTRLLQRRLGSLPDALFGRVEELTTAQVEDLAEALPTFDSIANLESWLDLERSV